MGLSYSQYKSYISSLEWKAVRDRALEYYGKICRACGVAKELHVHHLHYRNLGEEQLEDLMPLCSTCHDLVHSYCKRNKGTIEQLTHQAIEAIKVGTLKRKCSPFWDLDETALNLAEDLMGLVLELREILEERNEEISRLQLELEAMKNR